MSRGLGDVYKRQVILAVKGSAAKDVQFWNAYCPIDVMFSDNTIVANLEQLLKV